MAINALFIVAFKCTNVIAKHDNIWTNFGNSEHSGEHREKETKGSFPDEKWILHSMQLKPFHNFRGKWSV